MLEKRYLKRLDIKFLPKLTFVEDNSFEYAEKIEKIIRKIKTMTKKKKIQLNLRYSYKRCWFNRNTNWSVTNKITKLSEHFKKFKKDKHSTLGLTKSVNKRKNFLLILKRKILSLPKSYKTTKYKEIMFKIHKEELEVNGKKLTLETGKVARQADGAIIATLR